MLNPPDVVTMARVFFPIRYTWLGNDGLADCDEKIRECVLDSHGRSGAVRDRQRSDRDDGHLQSVGEDDSVHIVRVGHRDTVAIGREHGPC